MVKIPEWGFCATAAKRKAIDIDALIQNGWSLSIRACTERRREKGSLVFDFGYCWGKKHEFWVWRSSLAAEDENRRFV